MEPRLQWPPAVGIATKCILLAAIHRGLMRRSGNWRNLLDRRGGEIELRHENGSLPDKYDLTWMVPHARGRLHALRHQTHRPSPVWVLAFLMALGAAMRFASLGEQSFHHDEVITAARVIPGSFTEML